MTSLAAGRILRVDGRYLERLGDCSGGDGMSDTARGRILIVDDDKHVLNVTGDFLAAHGYEVLRAASGREALRTLETETVDLILLDVMMPGMDGGDVAQAIRDNRRLQRLPVIYFTAAVDAREVERHGGVIGGEAYVSKLSDPSVLLAAVEKHIRKVAPPGKTG